MTKKKSQELVIFKGKNGQVELRGDFSNETIWATLDQISDMFGRDKSVISRHFTNIFKEGELDKNATVAKNATVQIEGKRAVSRDIEYYNLDAIISVGYRVNSKTATQFRQWATTVLRQHITQGFTINRSRIATNYNVFMEAVNKTRSLLPAESGTSTGSVLELVQLFADTWFSLDAYDKEQLSPRKVSKKRIRLTAEEFMAGVGVFKEELIKKKEATENFAQERNRESIEGIIGNVMQSFGGKSVYPTIEEKAAHLLYFIVKNHPFVDGNKRSGAYAFVWFLKKARVLDTDRLTPSALTALTLLTAESNPRDKDKIISLVVMLISR